VATTLDDVADKIVAELDGLTFTDGGGTTATCKSYKWNPRAYDQLPVGTVGMPEVRRVGPDEAESQLGSDDWFLDYPVELAVALEEAVYAQATAISFLDAFIAAIDANQTLTSTVLDAKVVEAIPFAEEDRNRPILGFECTVRVWKLV
jgi:hypothetical protein